MATTIIRPTSDSSIGNWLNSDDGNTNLYSYVDEEIASDLDYNTVSISYDVGNATSLLFNFGDVSLSGSPINKVTLSCRLNYNVMLLYRFKFVTHSMTYLVSTTVPSSGYSTVSYEMINNPYTGLPWTEEEVNALVAGVAVGTKSSKNQTGSISQAYITVDYGATNPVFSVGVPGTMADDAMVGTVAWSGPDNAKVEDGLNAIAELVSGEYSHYLKATNFNFAIPTGATIDGIVVEIKREKNLVTSTDTFDSELKIIKADGSLGSTNKYKVPVWEIFTENYVSYGSSTDLWDEEWTAEDINDDNFGVVYSAFDGWAFIDHIRIAVYYTESNDREITITHSIGFQYSLTPTKNISKALSDTIGQQFNYTYLVLEAIYGTASGSIGFQYSLIFAHNINQALSSSIGYRYTLTFGNDFVTSLSSSIGFQYSLTPTKNIITTLSSSIGQQFNYTYLVLEAIYGTASSSIGFQTSIEFIHNINYSLSDSIGEQVTVVNSLSKNNVITESIGWQSELISSLHKTVKLLNSIGFVRTISFNYNTLQSLFDSVGVNKTLAFTHNINEEIVDSIGEQLQIEGVHEAATEVSNSIGYQTSITWEYGIHSVILDSIGFNFVKTTIKDVYTTILNSLKSTISYRSYQKKKVYILTKLEDKFTINNTKNKFILNQLRNELDNFTFEKV